MIIETNDATWQSIFQLDGHTKHFYSYTLYLIRMMPKGPSDNEAELVGGTENQAIYPNLSILYGSSTPCKDYNNNDGRWY